MPWEDAYIGFGSNMGDPVANVREAVDRLFSIPDVQSVRVSSLYRTEPVGWEAQDWFVNGVVRVKTRLTPGLLMAELLNIERHMGRLRSIPDGPRVIDLDLLLFGNRVVAQGDLKIPHPRMQDRKFVLVPLCEIAPQVRHPILGKTCRELLKALQHNKTVEHLAGWEEVQWG